LSWLQQQTLSGRYYWAERNREFEVSGLGECDIIAPCVQGSISSAMDAITARLPEGGSQIRYFGGCRFHRCPPKDGIWRDFSAYRFVLPLVELIRRENEYFMACNINGNMSKEKILDCMQYIDMDVTPSDDGLPEFSCRVDLPDQTAWETLVNKALNSIALAELQKVVLARQTTFHAASAIDPFLLLHHIKDRQEGTFVFCFEPAPGRAFLGASPERLFKRTKQTLFSEALAGTKPRGKDEGEDARLEEELLNSRKERYEHHIVLNEIKTLLEPYCSAIEYPHVPEVLKLAHCQHLYSPINCELKENVNDSLLLNILHPTPAVGGSPREKAVTWLQDEEPFERGIYAAPVGWLGKEESEFCVGIRSGLVMNNFLSLYSGAGIVEGSLPAEEWAELNTKLEPFMQIISRTP